MPFDPVLGEQPARGLLFVSVKLPPRVLITEVIDEQGVDLLACPPRLYQGIGFLRESFSDYALERVLDRLRLILELSIPIHQFVVLRNIDAIHPTALRQLA